MLRIRRDLERVQVRRRVRREGRRRRGMPVVALCGYTNAGKTTLLNRLTGARFTAANQLFVTLDPAARLVDADGHRPFILTDTVGFIRKLPHELVAAFRATLEELTEADVLLHVVDASHPAVDEHVEAVERLLRELGADDRPTLMVLNKIDRMTDFPEPLADRRDAVRISAATGEGIDALIDRVAEMVSPLGRTVRLRIPHTDGAALARCYEHGHVVARTDEADHVELDVELAPGALDGLLRYRA
jgi:GTP-binding protein HflX